MGIDIKKSGLTLYMDRSEYYRAYYLQNREVLAQRAKQYYWDVALHKRVKKRVDRKKLRMKSGKFVVSFA